MDATAEELLHFWLEEVGPEGWYKVDEALDAEIRDRWGALWDVGADRRARGLEGAGRARAWRC